MKEKTQHIAFMIFAGVTAVGFMLTVLALAIYAVDIEIGFLRTTEKNEILSNSYGLFTFKSGLAADLPGALERTFGDSGLYAGFESEINGVTNLGVMLTVVAIALGSGTVFAGFFVRVFTQKRRAATALFASGLAVEILAAIIYVIMLTNFNSALKDAFLVGLGKCIGGDDGYSKAHDMFATHASVGTASALLPLFGACISAIFAVMPFFKPFRKPTYF